jgi:hypothetical protein
MRIVPVVVLLAALQAEVAPSLLLLAQRAAPGIPTLQPARSVVGRVLTSRADPALRIRVDERFTYAGGQRFILRDVADAEQHFFVESLPGRDSKAIRRLYWIQFEQYLPGRGGSYNYDADAALNAWGLALRTHVRRFVEPPSPGSDRFRVHEFLERTGYRVPDPSIRARLVFVPEANRRQELMIIYLEAAGSADPTDAERSNLIQRAIAGLQIMQ